MNVPSFQIMFQLWRTKGAKLSADRVNGHDRQRLVLRDPVRKNLSLIENLNEVERAQDE